jgi:hypothetical protein
MLLRFTYEDVKGTWPKNQDTMLQNGSVGNVIRMDNRTQEKVTQMADRTQKETFITLDSVKLWRPMRTF